MYQFQIVINWTRLWNLRNNKNILQAEMFAIMF